MNFTKVNCSSCNKELHIKVATGFKAPDKSMCKACSQVGLFTAVFTNKKPRRYIKRSKTWMKN